jgi:(p)ppGpp synthase/HD superfamily hydrolase
MEIDETLPDEGNFQSFLTNRFEEALVYAAQIHKKQWRKGSHIPYISHLLSVAALVLEDGGDEDQAIAALLHDAVEDQGGLERKADIEKKFGEHIAQIVLGCSDAFSVPKPAWRKRKETYLRHLAQASPEVIRVSMADKVHNARTILADYRRSGDEIWGRFKGGKEGTLWYYHELIKAYPSTGDGFLLAELKRIISELDQLIAENDQA